MNMFARHASLVGKISATGTLALIVSGVLTSSAWAQAPGGTATSLPPSWYGVWQGAGSPQGFPPVENSKAVQEGTQAGAETNLPASYFYQNLQPWAQQRYLTTEWELDDLGQRCQLMGIFRQGHGNNSTFRFMESTPGKFYRTSGTYEETGLHPIRFGGPRPLNIRPTFSGDARARWDGETLVIDVQGFNDQTWLNTDRWPHTEALRVIERYRLVGDGTYMELRVFLDDHRAFKSPMTYTRYYRKAPEPVRSTENICNPQEEGENLWWERYQAAREDHQAKLDAFIKQTLARPAAPAYSGPARTGPAGGGRGGRGAAPPPPADPDYPAGGAPGAAQAPAGRGAGGGGRGGAAPVAALAVTPMTADEAAKLRTFTGAWRLGAFDAVAPGGLRNAGTLADLALTPEGLAAQKQHNVANDPAKFCQAVGPFRMLARAGNAFEILPTGQGAVMVFESTSIGNKRDFIFGRANVTDGEPTWLGDSVGRFEGDVLVVSTTRFNNRTWLNDAAAQHGPAMRLTERYRLVPNSPVLELRVTVEDPAMLRQPYSYTRYYQRGAEIAEDQCYAEMIK
jgi:hypothetical protein